MTDKELLPVTNHNDTCQLDAHKKLQCPNPQNLSHNTTTFKFFNRYLSYKLVCAQVLTPPTYTS